MNHTEQGVICLNFSLELGEMIDIEWTEYHTKGDLLRGIGKKANDNKLVDRMIWRWEVYLEDWVYHYIGSIDVKDLINEIKNLRGWIKAKLGAQEEKSNKVENTLTPDIKKQIDDLNSDLEFQIKENEKLEKKVATFQECIRRCYLRAQNVKKDKTPWPVFKKEVLKLEENISGEDNQ